MKIKDGGRLLGTGDRKNITSRLLMIDDMHVGEVEKKTRVRQWNLQLSESEAASLAQWVDVAFIDPHL